MTDAKKDDIGGLMIPGFEADTSSINGNANLLVEIAALLYKGRLDRDLGTLCRVPPAHEEVAKEVDKIARFADDSYGDLVLLLFALATKLRQTGQTYLAVDAAVQAELNRVLAEGQYKAPVEGGPRHGHLSR
jgi:hypothetical protein